MINFDEVQGDHIEQGRQLGQQQREAIASFLADGLCRLHGLSDQKWSLSDLRPLLHAHEQVIARETPHMHRLIQGLAQGAGITVDEALLLQLRREAVGYQKVQARGECTSFVVAVDSSLHGAQTIDLNGCMDDHMRVVRYVDPAGHSVLMLTYTGLLGFMGLNDRGVGVLINLVVGGQWRPGIPPYLVVRDLLEQPTLDAARERLQSLPLASSRSLTLFDAHRHVNVEIYGDARVEAERPWSLHTNHYLAEEFVAGDALNVFARSDSRKRMNAASALLKETPVADVESLFSVMTSHGSGKDLGAICVHGAPGDQLSDRTVAAAALDVGGGRMHVRVGLPCLSQTTVISVRP